MISYHIISYHRIHKQAFQLCRCLYILRVTSQTSYSPEYITPTYTHKKKCLNSQYIFSNHVVYFSRVDPLSHAEFQGHPGQKSPAARDKTSHRDTKCPSEMFKDSRDKKVPWGTFIRDGSQAKSSFYIMPRKRKHCPLCGKRNLLKLKYPFLKDRFALLC